MVLGLLLLNVSRHMLIRLYEDNKGAVLRNWKTQHQASSWHMQMNRLFPRCSEYLNS